MKLTVKTLKGEKFDVLVEESHTIAEIKGIIESQKAELPAATLKLIHSGKILKDEESITSCGIKENDFLVVMVTKPKKAAPKVETAAAATAAAPAVEPTPTNAATTAAAAGTATTTPAASATATTPAAPRAADTFPDEIVTNLTSMGFPEAEVRHCLRAAHGNPDVAVEFLTNGIPEGVMEAATFVNATTGGAASATPAATASSSSAGGGGAPLQALRNHPQFDALRRLVQSNPGALQQVLTQIGQQQPDLLAEINANQAIFLEMMNEPVSAAAVAAGSPGSAASAAAAGSMMEGMGGNPAQMAQMIQSMSENELQQMAHMMGLSPDQLRTTAQMIGQMPADQLNQFMMQAMGGQDGGGGGHGGGGGGQQVLRLTEEEMAAVDRLTEMGFDRSEAAQAFLACDKNEALAANLLMDSMASGGFFGGDGGGGGAGNDGGDNNDDDDNMYD